MTDSDAIPQTEQPAPAAQEQPVAPPHSPAPAPHSDAPAEHSSPSHPGGHAPAGESHSQPRHEGRREGHREGHREGEHRDSAPREPRPPRQLREENTIFIGRKATMGYVLAVVTQFQNGAPEVKIKARGKIISMAVDVAEIVRHRFLPNVKAGPITIQTEDVENEDHSRSKVSSIQIVLLK